MHFILSIQHYFYRIWQFYENYFLTNIKLIITMTPHASKTWMNIGFHSIFSSFFKYIFGYLHVFILFLYLPFCYFHENTSFFFSTQFLNIFASGWCAFIHTPLPLHYTLNLGYVTLLFYFIFFVLATKKFHTTCFSHIIFPITSSSLF